MAVTEYYAVGGRILGQEASGLRTDFLTDALGSVTATLDSSQAVINTYRHKPYGTRLAKTGSGADPKFQWTGSTGSRASTGPYISNYNRNRHRSAETSTWTSQDPIWPGAFAYVYVRGNPTTLDDPLGLAQRGQGNCCDEITAEHWKEWQEHCRGGTWERCGSQNDLNDSFEKCKRRLGGLDRWALCDEARAQISAFLIACTKSYGKESPWAGMTICCYDSFKEAYISCGTYCCTSNMSPDPCVRYCTLKHEERHVRQCLTTGIMNEVCAYMVAAKCLFDLYRDMCAWTDPPSVFGSPWSRCDLLSRSCQLFG